MKRTKLKPKKTHNTTTKSSMKKQNDKKENPSENDKDNDDRSAFVKRILNDLPNKFEKMAKRIDEFQSTLYTQTKPEIRGRVQTKTISEKIVNAIIKLNLTESGLSINEIDPKTNEIQIIEVDLSESERELFKLPEDYVVIEAATESSSFFDSFRQGLVALGGHIGVPVTYLRAICAQAARTPPPWLAKAIMHAHLSTPAGADLGATPDEFAERTLHRDGWGEIKIHGRILCEYFDITLYVLEADSEKNIKRSLVFAEGVSSVDDVPFGRPNTIYMINRGQNNFEPLLSTSNRARYTIKSNTDSSLGNNIDSATKPVIKLYESSESKASTSVVNDKGAPLTETSPQIVQAQTSTSFTPVKKTGLELSKEFEIVQSTIKSRNINELKIALEKHYMVMPLSEVDPLLMELSLYDAIVSNDIHIVDMVYNHWSRIIGTAEIDLLIYYLKLLGTALAAARDSCKELLDIKQQLCVVVHCISEFNKFKIELSRELLAFQTNVSSASDPKTWEEQLQQILDILTTVFDVYDEFCDKNIRLTKDLTLDKIKLQPSLNDHTTKYYKYLLYCLYEYYYHKLDFCIASVILEHFHSLKLRLELPPNTYQEIESALYYFIYRVNEDWRLYLPENRNITIVKYPIGNPPQFIEIPIDTCRLQNSPVIYLEWEKFKLSVKQLQNELEHPNVMDRIRVKGFRLPADEENTLTLLPSLRDEHSLRKMVKYLETCERSIQGSSRKDTALIVQRVLQVIGEYIKSKSNNTVHLSFTTKSLLHVFIPGSTLKHLENLRNDFSHIMRDNKKPNLIRRINLEETNLDLFFDVAKDLEHFKLAVNEVIHLYKLVLEKSLLREGINLLASRVKDLKRLYDQHLLESGISEQLEKEHDLLDSNINDLTRKFMEKEADCKTYIITKMQAFIDCINNILDDIKTYTNKGTGNDKKTNEEKAWKIILNLLQFIMEHVFQENSEFKSNYLTLQKIPSEKKMTDGIVIVKKLLDLLKQETNTYSQNNNLTLSITQVNTPNNYYGIKKLDELMSEIIYTTNEEKEYLKSKIGQHRGNEPLLEKVLNNEKIKPRELNALIKNIDMDDKCKSIMGYLNVRNKRPTSAPLCLAKRAALLKDVITSNNVPLLVEKYHHDKCFQMLTESILADICMIYADCKFPDNYFFYDDKRRQLAEFSLRKFFAHGHPLLEVIGQVLDPSELPAALFRFALLVVEDERALAEVAKLYEEGVTAEEALTNWTGPQTPRLEYYFKEPFYSLPTSEKSAKSANSI